MGLMRANISFWHDNRRCVKAGQTVDSEHPVAQAHPDKFDPVQPDIQWETATASPGPVRHVTPAQEPDVSVAKPEGTTEPPVVTNESTASAAPKVEVIDPDKFTLVELRTIARREKVSDAGGDKAVIAKRINEKRASAGE